ncbi:hypothetical protein [Streptomyces sp. VB1]|nr:hypothetical protein [Streptomyces sp. VB1]UZI26643.1 hypothetical protein OH133_00110 [Streptomyces sp. VB1]
MLAVLLAVVTGIASAFAAFIIGNQVTQSVAEPLVWAAATSSALQRSQPT